MPNHDLAGLEATLERSGYLEGALENLCAFCNRYAGELTPRQQEFLKTAIHTTACVFNDMLHKEDCACGLETSY